MDWSISHFSRPIILAVVALTAYGGAALAASGPSVTSIKAPPNSQEAVEAYWTAERMATAKPMPLPLADSGTPAVDAPVGVPSVSSPSFDTSSAESRVQLFDPALYPSVASDDAVAPMAEGTFLAPYTSSRLETTAFNKNVLYKKVGKLFFVIPPGTTQPPGNYVCSASIISYRIVVTAGHCVSDGSGHFYNNWQFVPAYQNGVAPYQVWSWAQVTVTNVWHFGGGGVPNAADYAMIVVPDKLIGTIIKKIGTYLGFYGWRTGVLSRTHVKMLGYPCNWDNCEIMHQNNAGPFRATAPNNMEYGSDMRGGSSGGPWIQNFGTNATATPGPFGSNAVRNEVVGITSYGYVSTDPKVQGASIPDANWVAVWNTVCGGAGNCTK